MGGGVFSEWLSRAACKGETDSFFSYDEEVMEEARAICEDCPVRKECLQTALADRNHYGVWGGTTASERRRIHRTRATADPTSAGGEDAAASPRPLSA